MSTNSADKYPLKGYAIYLTDKRALNPCVLLSDGCYTDQRNCLHREHGYIWHRPMLFATRGGARNYMNAHGLDKRHSIRKYTGPAEPWERN